MTATWTTPRTWATGEIVTAAQLNQHLRDNLDYLAAPPAATSYQVSGSIMTTSSTTFVDVTGASVSVTSCGGRRLFCTASITVTGLSAASYYATLSIDGTDLNGPSLGLSYLAANQATFTMSYLTGVIAAGVHTWKARIRVSVNSLTVQQVSLMVWEV